MASTPGRAGASCARVPFTVSLPEELMPSALKEMSPASSRATEERVRECFLPRTPKLTLGEGFRRTPSFCQVPSTSSWDTSTSKVTVPFSATSRAWRPFTSLICLTGKQHGKVGDLTPVNFQNGLFPHYYFPNYYCSCTCQLVGICQLNNHFYRK